MLFLSLDFSQNIIHLTAFRETVPDTYPNAAVVRAAQSLVYVRQAVVAAVAALLAHTHASKWKCKIVADDKKMLQRYIFLLHPVIDSPSAEVHIGGRLKENEFASPI